MWGAGSGSGKFERRGREGFAKGAKKDKEDKKVKDKRQKKKIRKPNLKYFLCKSRELIFVFFWYFLFCALCETFAPSAFKKSPVFKS